MWIQFIETGLYLYVEWLWLWLLWPKRCVECQFVLTCTRHKVQLLLFNYSHAIIMKFQNIYVHKLYSTTPCTVLYYTNYTIPSWVSQTPTSHRHSQQKPPATSYQFQLGTQSLVTGLVAATSEDVEERWVRQAGWSACFWHRLCHGQNAEDTCNSNSPPELADKQLNSVSNFLFFFGRCRCFGALHMLFQRDEHRDMERERGGEKGMLNSYASIRILQGQSWSGKLCLA